MNPREWLDWAEAFDFCRAHGLRLPSEAEWELACRGGARTAYCFGARLPEEVVAFPSLRNVTLPVASPGAVMNTYGLFDVHGSVWEWTMDVDPAPGNTRVARGGENPGQPPRLSRAADRHRWPTTERSPIIGLRLAADLR